LIELIKNSVFMTALRMNSEQRNQLCNTAQEAALLAYAPYSSFRVGAALLAKAGIYRGTNVENASYGLSLCAERSALAAAIAQGERDIQAIAIACIDPENCQDIQSRVPCGACRQWLAELAPEAEVIICGTNAVFRLEELMPMSFRLLRAEEN
jgi:cytidine deaminase